MNWQLFFLDLALRGVLISAAAGLAVWRLHGRLRTVACALSLWALLVLPLAQLLPRWEITLPDAASAVLQINVLLASWQFPAVVWGAGFLIVSARLLPGWWQLRQWVRASLPAEGVRLQRALAHAAETLTLRRTPVLRLTAQRAMPAAFGWWTGSVFLPADAVTWSDERLRMVLLHELAHLKRRDPAMQALGHLACALHWFNPLVWVLHRTWLRERELAADTLVLSTGVPPRGYAMHLVDIAERFRLVMPRSVPAAAMASHGLERRVRSILQYVPRPVTRRTAAALVLTLCVAVTSLATVLPRPLAPEWRPLSPLEREARIRLAADPFPAGN